MTQYSYLASLTDEQLEALRQQTEEDVSDCTQLVIDAQEASGQADAQQSTAEQAYNNAKSGQNVPPSVTNETNVDSGAFADVVEFIGVDIPVNFVGYTGNGDDGFGIVTDWSVPDEIRFNFNLQVYTSGEKVDDTASLLSLDGIGGILGAPNEDNTLLVNQVGIIIPDLFDPNVERNPDNTFEVTVGPELPSQIFVTSVFAAAADQVFDVTVYAAVPDQIFDVRSIDVLSVDVAEPPFIVAVFAEPADQVFNVITSAVPADQTFSVTRGPELADQILDVKVIQNHDVSVSFAIADQTFFVTTGPDPAPTPDQIFDVSVGGPDAPPVPTPNETFVVTTGVAIPNQIFSTKVITAFDVFTQTAPFVVTVGPDLPDQIFDVTTGAIPFNQKFTVAVGPDVPDQVFTATAIETFEVTAYNAPKSYSIEENNTPAYVVSGEGLAFAVAPTLSVYPGQHLNFSLSVANNPLWITDTQQAGQGSAPSTFGATVSNNGGTSGSLLAQFYQPGTYYYQSENNAGVFGQIDVFGAPAGSPDQTFSVTVFAEPADQTFVVTRGASTPDAIFTVKTGEIFDVTVGPEIPSQTFEVIVYAENPDTTFQVSTGELPLNYTVTNSGSGDYLFNGEGLVNSADPTLNAVTGQPVRLTMNAGGHPLWIGASNSTGAGVSSAVWADTLINNGLDSGGIIEVIFNTAGTYHYNCQFHSSMHGTIIVT